VPRILKLVLSYDGTDYVGWQRQPNGVTIQALVEDAIAPIEGKPVTVVGAGRTDSGVHALAQTASVALASGLDAAALARALNATLPPDVRVREASEAPPGFHARSSARSKAYRYYIRAADVVSPFERRYVWHVPADLDDAAMAAAAEALRGSHDFAAFQASGSEVATTTRTILDVALTRVDESDGSLVTIDVEANGFLRHMVRNIVGTLVDVGRGRRDPDEVGRILASGDRTQAGATAPPQGLFLVRVTY
jgi:tRNA pseudouridine38-40 synthase